MFSNPLTRLQRVGALSLAALIAGGTILILFGVNVQRTKTGYLDDRATEQDQAVFRVGSHLSPQTWLAVLGVGFGLLSYGFAESYVHVFDWWCSWRARRATGPGLNYSRYLNSMPRAPVVMGLRHGFPVFVLCRYIVTALGIAASVGYKFAVVEVTVQVNEQLAPEQVRLQLPPLRGLENGTTSPWLGDAPLMETNRAFLHQQLVWTDRGYKAGDALRPPFNITMAGWANCSDVFHLLDEGRLYTREIVMVANMTEEEGEFFVTSEQGGWTRVESSAGGWINGSNERAVIDYRIVQPGKVQIQWAKLGRWLNDTGSEAAGERQRVERRLTYDMRYAVAEVRRVVAGGSCSRMVDQHGSMLSGAKLLATGSIPIKTAYPDGSIPTLNHKLVEAILSSGETGPREGVSAFVRSAMAGWGAHLAEMEKVGFRLGHAPPDIEPFGKEDNDGTMRSISWIELEYPFYRGTRASRRTGSYHQVANTFMALGIIAILLAVVRVGLGPPTLTSWMGQHVYLASEAGQVGREGADQLATGYQVAPSELGVLRLAPELAKRRFVLHGEPCGI